MKKIIAFILAIIMLLVPTMSYATEVISDKVLQVPSIDDNNTNLTITVTKLSNRNDITGCSTICSLFFRFFIRNHLFYLFIKF